MKRSVWCVWLVLAVASLGQSQELASREPLPKAQVSAARMDVGDSFGRRLIVKFADDLRVRATPDGGVRSLLAADLSAVEQLAGQRSLRFSPLIRLSEDKLQSLQDRAAARSGIAQPDLAGTLVVTLPLASTEALEALGNALLALEEVEFAHVQMLGAPPPGDILPPTPDLVQMQTYRGEAPGMNAEFTLALGVDGAGIRFSDCEYGWNPDHEDLNDIDLHLEPGQTIHPNVIGNGWDEHGTAVVGQTSAVVNEYGCSGMVPGAEVYTYPEWTVEEGFRRVTCITNAIADSGAGDVVLLEMQTGGAGGGFGPAELDPAVWMVTRVGSDAGVIVVGAAGNGNQDLDSPAYDNYRNMGDSGAIIVGAGTSSTSHSKLSFSTFGMRVNVQGWGHNVFTLGYGNFAEYGGDKNQRYTDSFGGTSSASPFVASASVAMQHLSLLSCGDPMGPSELRDLLMQTGVPQGSGGHIGPFVDLQAAAVAFGLPSTAYCTAKTNSCGGVPAIAGAGFPSASASSGFVVSASGTKAQKSGLLLYTDAGRALPAVPFQGGVLCLAAPISRSIAVVDSNGNAPACDGTLAVDMNAFAAGALGGNPLPALLVPGTVVDCQFWGRDTLAAGSLLSDALEYRVCP